MIRTIKKRTGRIYEYPLHPILVRVDKDELTEIKKYAKKDARSLGNCVKYLAIEQLQIKIGNGN